MTLEARALSLGLRKLVLIERLGSDFENMRSIVQRARERMLAEDLTAKSHHKTETRLIGRLEASERTKDDALALLQQLGLAAMVLDERGQIAFATDRTLEMLGIAAQEAIGQPWDQVLSFRKEDRPVPVVHSVSRGLVPDGLSWRFIEMYVIPRAAFWSSTTGPRSMRSVKPSTNRLPSTIWSGKAPPCFVSINWCVTWHRLIPRC